MHAAHRMNSVKHAMQHATTKFNNKAFQQAGTVMHGNMACSMMCKTQEASSRGRMTWTCT